MDKESAVKQLVKFVSDNYMVDVDDVPIDKSLIDEGIIDSFGLIEIASYLERTYDIVIKDDEMIRENFGSIVKLVNFVARKSNEN